MEEAFGRDVMELEAVEIAAGAVLGNDHNRRWSPDVASRSVKGFVAVGGSHSTRVTGYVRVASANFENSIDGSPRSLGS